MADRSEKVCAFCQGGEREEEEAGRLRKVSNKNILAHSNCLLYSPRVVTIPPTDPQDKKVEFDIPSVLKEIARGKKLKCSYCKKRGATVGCNIKKCKKTYHYLCVTKDGGKHIRDEDKEEYVAYCFSHSERDEGAQNGQLGNDSETSRTSIISGCSNKSQENKTLKKRKKKMKHKTSTIRKRLRFEEMHDGEAAQNSEMCYDSEDEQRRSPQLLDNHTKEKDTEVQGPSRTYLEHKDFVIRSDSESDVESNGSCSSQKRIEQNAAMRVESETKQRPTDHTDQEDKKKSRPYTSMLLRGQNTIVIESDTEDEDELPVFDGSQIHNLGSSTDDDIPVASTSPDKNFSSPPSERHSTPSSNTDSSSGRTPEIHRAISLSGFPKRNRKRKRKRNNPELETALLTMQSDEINAYSQLYDEVGGSMSMSQDINTHNDWDADKMEDSSNVTVEDIPKDQHTGTHERSDGSNPRIYAPESSMLKMTVHDALTPSPSGQPLNITNKVNHPADVANGSERLSTTSGTMLTPAHPSDSAEGKSNARAQPKDISNGTDKLVSTGAVTHTPMKPLDDQPLSSSSSNKPLDKNQLMTLLNNTNISNEQHNKDTKNKDSFLENLERTMKKHAAQHLPFSRYTSSFSKTLGSTNSDILSDKEPVSKSRTSSEQPVIFQLTRKSSEDQCKRSPGVSKTSGEQPTMAVITTGALVHAVISPKSDVSVDQTAKVLKRQSQSEAHLSATTTGTDLSIRQLSCSSIGKNKCNEMAPTCPETNDFLAEESVMKESATSRKEVLPTSPGIRGGKASEVQNETCYLNPQLKKLSAQLKQGAFHKKFSLIRVQIQSTINSAMTPQSILQSKDDDVTSKRSLEPTIASQTQESLSSLNVNLRTSVNTEQTEDEAASHGDLLEDEHMLEEEEERTHADVDSEPLSGDLLEKEHMLEEEEERTHAEVDSEPLSGDLLEEEHMLEEEEEERTHADVNSEPLSGDLLEEEHMLEEEERTHAEVDSEPLSGDVLENEHMLEEEEERTHADVDTEPLTDTENAAILTSKSSQTEISSGFPGNVDNPVNLNSDQKKQLMESYKETEKLMSRTGDMKAGAAQAFWELCQQNKCREYLLTLMTCYIKSVIHKIVSEEPEDRDFDQAFAILQASGCFAYFINGSEDDQEKMNSRIGNNKPYNKSNSDSIDCCTEKKDQREFARDKNPDGMEPEPLETCSAGNKVGQCTRDEGPKKVETVRSKTTLSIRSKVKKRSKDKEHNNIQGELSGSSSESNRKEGSSRKGDNDGIQSELSKSSSQSNRKEGSCRDEDDDGMQCELSGSSSESSRKERSTKGENLSRMKIESPESSLFSASASSRSDLMLAENTSIAYMTEVFPVMTMGTQQQLVLYPVPQQQEDGDAGFATSLIQHLRKVPQDKKLSTQISILSVLSSVLYEQPMSTSNPGCVPQQYTNPSSPRLSGQTQNPKP